MMWTLALLDVLAICLVIYLIRRKSDKAEKAFMKALEEEKFREKDRFKTRH